MIEMHFVVSSNVNRIGYSPHTYTITVEFKNSSIYEYQNVSENVWTRFLNSGSKGKYVKKILSAYPCVKIR